MSPRATEVVITSPVDEDVNSILQVLWNGYFGEEINICAIDFNAERLYGSE